MSRAPPLDFSWLRFTSSPSQNSLPPLQAAEALGNIAGEASSVLPVLQSFCSDTAPEVRETCQLACRRLQAVSGSRVSNPEDTEDFGSRVSCHSGDTESVDGAGASKLETSRFATVDPAVVSNTSASTAELRWASWPSAGLGQADSCLSNAISVIAALLKF